LFANEKGDYEPITYKFYSGTNDALFMQHIYTEGDSPVKKLLKGKKAAVK
jgi:hypothetical protein